MIRIQFSQFKGTITQALIVLKSVEIDDFWTLDMSISTLDMAVPTLDMLLSTLDNYPDSLHLSSNYFLIQGKHDSRLVLRFFSDAK